MKEYKVKKLTKLIETGFRKWIVTFDGEEIGTVEHTHGRGYRAISKSGRYIGSGSNKAEAKMFVAWDFYGMENIIWEEEK
jgi:hypothetical protein